MPIYRVNLNGTAFVNAESKEKAEELAQDFLEVVDLNAHVTLASEPQPHLEHEDELVVSRSWLRGLHETAIHEFNQAPADRPSFRSGYWNGYGMAVAAILKYFPDGSQRPS